MVELLFRVSKETVDEYELSKKYFDTKKYLTELKGNSLVLARYSVLPFYTEVEESLHVIGSRLLNTYNEHRYIASMDWYHDLSSITPETWFGAGYLSVPKTEHGYVVKGATNSRKTKWDTHMFAKTREDLRDVLYRLHDDSLISTQDIVIREYVPLVKLEEGINGLPVTNEFRFFFYKGELIVGGYYWSWHEGAESIAVPDGAIEKAHEASERIKDKTSFYVIDIAEKVSGGYTVIEVNDGQMSGISMCDPNVLYSWFKERFSC